MDTVKIDLHQPDIKLLTQAAKVLETGGIVIHPTDTAYGLAADIFNTEAINRIYAIKGRDFNKKLITCVRDLTMAEDLVILNTHAKRLFTAFLPGPLTLVLPKKATPSDSMAIRVPNCQLTLELSNLCPFPYTTTSANPSGQPNPYSPSDILSRFTKEALEQVDLFLDAGTLPETPPSTVIDLTLASPKILRQGPISAEQIFSVLDLHQ